MHIYLAGENGKWKLVREFNSWGGYDGYVSRRRDNREPLSALAENSKWGGGMNIYLAGEHPVKNGRVAHTIIGGGAKCKDS